MPRKRRVVAARRNLTAEDIRRIAALVRMWPENEQLTWNALAAACGKSIGHAWTRQTLEAQIEIKGAYTARRNELKPATRKRARNPEETALQKQVGGLKAENELLRKQITVYEEAFVRYQFNSKSLGISRAMLERPLSKVDKDRTRD